eukprot:363907_1
MAEMWVQLDKLKQNILTNKACKYISVFVAVLFIITLFINYNFPYATYMVYTSTRSMINPTCTSQMLIMNTNFLANSSVHMINKPLVFTITNYGFITFAKNWILNLQNQRILDYIVICTDVQCFEELSLFNQEINVNG